jgi:hypothetical protein
MTAWPRERPPSFVGPRSGPIIANSSDRVRGRDQVDVKTRISLIWRGKPHRKSVQGDYSLLRKALHIRNGHAEPAGMDANITDRGTNPALARS